MDARHCASTGDAEHPSFACRGGGQPPAFVHVRIRQASAVAAAGGVEKWETSADTFF
jgi:hypothetical protein